MAEYKINECIKNKSKELNLSNLNLRCLPKIPLFVTILRCNNKNLTELPEKLPHYKKFIVIIIK